MISVYKAFFPNLTLRDLSGKNSKYKADLMTPLSYEKVNGYHRFIFQKQGETKEKLAIVASESLDKAIKAAVDHIYEK